MTGRLPPLYEDEVVGVANVMQPFTITDDDKKKRPVAGSQCVKGEGLYMYVVFFLLANATKKT